MGVDTLECDVHVSADGVAMVAHDREYAGRLIPRLTSAELLAGTPVPTLASVLALMAGRRADTVRINIETKFDVLHPAEEAPREKFVSAVVATLRAADMLDRASVQSFDWTVLRMVREEEPQLALNGLANIAYLEEHAAGASPWLAGLDIDDFFGSVSLAAAQLGLDAISPSEKITTPALVTEAHRHDLRVLPYTVDDPATAKHLIDLGVDGLISNRPDLIREVLATLDLPLPPSYPEVG